MQYVDQMILSLREKDIFQIEFEDHPMEMTIPVHRETLESELNACVNDGILSDWLIDKVQKLLKNKYQLGDLPITTSEFEKTNAILEELRI